MSGTNFTKTDSTRTGFTGMSDYMASQKGKPDPTFLKDNEKSEAVDLQKPLGLVIEKRQQTLAESTNQDPLTRREFETLLDDFYKDGNGTLPGAQINQDHAQVAGGRMVRNLAFISAFALFVGFGFGFYALSQQGGETAIGQKFNQTVSNFWQAVSPNSNSAPSGGSNVSEQLGSNLAGKPIKTASIVVGDASGTLEAGIPLKLELKPGSNVDLLEVKIMNVPADAVLTAGVRRKDGVWILQPDDLAKVELVMSSPRKTPLRLDVELVEAKTGELLSPTREIKVAIIQPRPFKVGGL